MLRAIEGPIGVLRAGGTLSAQPLSVTPPWLSPRADASSVHLREVFGVQGPGDRVHFPLWVQVGALLEWNARCTGGSGCLGGSRRGDKPATWRAWQALTSRVSSPTVRPHLLRNNTVRPRHCLTPVLEKHHTEGCYVTLWGFTNQPKLEALSSQLLG